MGRWLGVPLKAHWSVLIVLFLFAAVLAGVDLPDARPGHSAAAYWVAGTATAVALFACLLAHEVAHAVTARHYGVEVRGITLWVLGGFSELAGESPSPRADGLIAAAGPLTSLGAGALAAGAAWLVHGAGLVGGSLVWLAEINVLLAVFNLLPGAPLDGGRLLRALIWRRTGDRVRASERAAGAGRTVGMVLVGLGLVDLVLGNFSGAWLALVGWFIIGGATTERYAARADVLHGLAVSDAMVPTPTLAPDWWTVDRFLASLTPQSARQPVFPLVDLEGRLTGVVTLRSLDHVPAQRRAETQLSHLGPRVDQLLEAAPTDDLAALAVPLHLRGGLAVVVEREHPVGVVTAADVDRIEELPRPRRSGEDHGGR